MIQRRTIECFNCRTPVDEADLDCSYCGRGVAFEAIERRETVFLLRCISGAVAGGAVLSAVALVFLAGFGGHEKTFILALVLAACITGLLWFAGDWFNPRAVDA